MAAGDADSNGACCGGAAASVVTSDGLTSGNDTIIGGASNGICCGGMTLTGDGASAALSFGATGAGVSFNMTVLLAISCKCCGCDAVESFDLLSSESVAGFIGGSMSIG